MGLWTKVERPAPPTTTDYVEAGEDVEKSGQSLDSRGDGQPHHVHPEIEKNLVRKMDFRIVPLVTALCSSSPISLY